jgi:hypothetical protein
MEAIKRQEAPNWVKTINAFNTYISQDFLGGPKLIKMAWVINLHKFLTMFIVAMLMIRSTTAHSRVVYMALHGSYGFAITETYCLRDPKWETE